MSQAAYTSYQHLICQLDPSVNPAAWKQHAHGVPHPGPSEPRHVSTGDSIWPAEMTEPEQRKMADSFGMAPQYEWWEAGNRRRHLPGGYESFAGQ